VMAAKSKTVKGGLFVRCVCCGRVFKAKSSEERFCSRDCKAVGRQAVVVGAVLHELGGTVRGSN
jgi:translation initiation factor 2 beta subunit (eIF-2beta)/eIF-5